MATKRSRKFSYLTGRLSFSVITASAKSNARDQCAVLLVDIGQLLTLRSAEEVPRRGDFLSELGIIEDAAVLGDICYRAFKAIAEAHGFLPDFPSAESGAGQPRLYLRSRELRKLTDSLISPGMSA